MVSDCAPCTTELSVFETGAASAVWEPLEPVADSVDPVVHSSVVVFTVSTFWFWEVVVVSGLEGVVEELDPSPSALGARVGAGSPEAGNSVLPAACSPETVNEGVLDGSEGGTVSVVDRMSEDDELTVLVSASASKCREFKKKRTSVSLLKSHRLKH